MKIVIVEDEIRIKEGLANLIAKLYPGHTVAATAEDGKEGLECIRRIRPDLVFTDIRMPVMDGLEMLEQLEREGIRVRAVILSAYTEFSYAQTAMRLGVRDYLVKPVAISEFRKIMQKMEEEVQKERQIVLQGTDTLSYLFSSLLHGTIRDREEVERYLTQKFGIRPDTSFQILICYIGKNYGKNLSSAKAELQSAFASGGTYGYEWIEMEKDRSLVVVLYQYGGRENFERWMQNRFFLGGEHEDSCILSCGVIEAESAGKIRSAYRILSQYMDWNIALGERILISWPKVLRIQTVPCVYPADLEQEMKAAVFASDSEKTERVLRRFFVHFKDGKIHAPKEIKECCVRFLWSLMNVTKEIRGEAPDGINQQELLEELMSARSMGELEELGLELLGKLRIERAEQVLSLPVMRAKNMATELYHTGITLEEIAQKLNLSAEYLGTQFRKETGSNFSAYIKKYRITRAKELLIGTSMRQYEIAKRVGYSDSKYFGKVFREIVGMSPTEYRQANR